MINFIKRKLKKRRDRRTFKTYGYEIQTFNIEGYQPIEFAHWLHPFNKPIEITESTIQFYKDLADPGSLIIDIGTYTGDTTVPMALAVGKEGLVIGLEPNQYAFAILEKNASLNSELTSIVPLNFAATEDDGEFTFNYSDASFCNGGFLSEIENQNHKHPYTLTVQGRNLENILNSQYKEKLSKLTLIKIDAEGYDKEILKTLANILSTYHPTLLVECYKKLTRDERYELYDAIKEHGYDIYRFDGFDDVMNKTKIERDNMMDHRHFEMMALYPAKQ